MIRSEKVVLLDGVSFYSSYLNEHIQLRAVGPKVTIIAGWIGVF
jgi:hypothetical protein